MSAAPPPIDIAVIARRVAAQFPRWAHLPIRPLAHSGWDNRMFHLGEQMIVRVPSAAHYSAQVEQEQRWLPILAPLLPLPIPTPLALGAPTPDLPRPWSIYNWLPGANATPEGIENLSDFARDLARFLRALHRINATDGPRPGPHNFYRGGPLRTYDAQTLEAINCLHDKIDTTLASAVWTTGCASHWRDAPVWIHGDVSLGNLLIQDGHLSAVIDFGNMGVGDPACDLAIAWTLFSGESRERFRAALSLDSDTWARGRTWTLWKAMIVAAGLVETNAVEGRACWRIIEAVLADHTHEANTVTMPSTPQPPLP
jgi:aminoglycoside phosphotransferase (APT) family kinase protein